MWRKKKKKGGEDTCKVGKTRSSLSIQIVQKSKEKHEIKCCHSTKRQNNSWINDIQDLPNAPK